MSRPDRIVRLEVELSVATVGLRRAPRAADVCGRANRFEIASWAAPATARLRYSLSDPSTIVHGACGALVYLFADRGIPSSW
jgi:hypothetical protein